MQWQTFLSKVTGGIRIRRRLVALTPVNVWRRFTVAREQVKACRLIAYDLANPSSDWLRVLRLVLWPRKTILFYPEVVPKGFVLAKLCTISNYLIVGDPRGLYAVRLKFHNTTYTEPALLQKGIPDVDTAINGRCFDISKRASDTVFEQVFGYPLALDPTTHVGEAVKKSNANYMHDGRVIECPIDPAAVRDDCVYQKVVDCRPDEQFFHEMRVIIIGDCIPVVYDFRIPQAMRFKSATKITLCEPSDLLTATEIEKLLTMARVMHLDIGELDVMRDDEDGRIYVFDVNNTPWGPSQAMPVDQRREALTIMRAPFERLIERYDL